MLSTQTRAILQQAGWTQGRRVEIGAYINVLEREGYPVFEVASAFLEEFGGLYVVNIENQVDFHFDPARAVQDVFIDWIKYYGDRASANLCLIGQAYKDHMALSIATDGAIYAGFDREFFRVGVSAEEAIETLCWKGEFTPIA